MKTTTPAALSRAICRSCLREALIPSNMTHAEWARWHNWTTPLEAHKGSLWGFCSLCRGTA